MQGMADAATADEENKQSELDNEEEDSIPDQPTPPESLPAYLSDPLTRQDNEVLEDVIDYAEQLIEYNDRQLTPAELEEELDIDTDSDDVEIENTEKGSIQKVKKKCGDPNCHCADGKKHGPYKYLYWREGGTVKSEYLGKVEN
jgi:hypothetical protein